MKTILISSIVSASSSVKNDLESVLVQMFADNNTDLKTCYDLLPEHGHIVSETCEETEEGTLTCNFKCDETDNLHLLKNIKMNGYEVSCRCHQTINGKRYKVPCAWSNLPSCKSLPQTVLPEYGSHCGELIDENGTWECSGSSCNLTCNHGYVPSDKDAQMSPRCTCNKFGDCSWFKPASCIQLNHQNGKCEPEESPVGVIECTGNSLGDICQLQCPEQFKAEQYGIRRCACDSAGACDWLGDRGRCEEDIELPPVLAAMENSSGSLLSFGRCGRLPETNMGFWQCDRNQTCQLVCPPGFEANQNLEISCLCANGNCIYQNKNSLDHRFQLDHFEETNNFECLALIDEDTPDSVIMETGIDRCSNLPRIENGAWNCTHGTCNLRCIGDNDKERFVVDCLADDTELIEWDSVNCLSFPQKKKLRTHSNLTQRKLALN